MLIFYLLAIMTIVGNQVLCREKYQHVKHEKVRVFMDKAINFHANCIQICSRVQMFVARNSTVTT